AGLHRPVVVAGQRVVLQVAGAVHERAFHGRLLGVRESGRGDEQDDREHCELAHEISPFGWDARFGWNHHGIFSPLAGCGGGGGVPGGPSDEPRAGKLPEGPSDEPSAGKLPGGPSDEPRADGPPADEPILRTVWTTDQIS